MKDTKSRMRAIMTGIIIILSMAFAPREASAYSFMPQVTCYATQEKLCGVQAWSATQDRQGILYFATSNGLLTYDGYRWERFEVPGVKLVRTVMADGNRVYVGAFEQPGYIERDQYGTPVYHSLRSMVRNYDMRDDDFWTIHQIDGKIKFQSFKSILTYAGDTITAMGDINPLFAFKHHGDAYYQKIAGGLYKTEGQTSREVLSRKAVGDDNVVAMLDLGRDKALLCTETSGLYIYNISNGTVTKLNTEVDNELERHQVNRAIKMRNGMIAIGTIRNGVYALDMDGRKKWHYNIENGLGNNSVLGLTEDMSGNVWVMLDYGISVIHSGLPFNFLKPHPGEPYIGTTYAVLHHGDDLLIGTNQGLYTYNYTTRRMTADPKVKLQIWHIDEIDGQTYVGGGTMSTNIVDGKVINIEETSSTDIKKGVIHKREVLVESTYYSLRIHTRGSDDQWHFSHTVENFGTPVRQVEIDNDGSIWCSHMSHGVIHMELTPDLKKIERIEKFKRTSKDKSNQTSFVMKLRGQIVVSDCDSLYTYDRQRRGFTAMTGLHNDLGTASDVYSATQVDDNLFWLSSYSSYALVEYRDGHFRRVLTIPLEHLTLQSNGLNNKIFVDDELNCFFSLNNGVGHISLAGDYKPVHNTLMSITEVEHTNSNGETALLPLMSDENNPVTASNNIKFKLCYPVYNIRSTRFVYTLEGPTVKTEVSDVPEVSYMGLSHGKYRFKATMIDDDGRDLLTKTYHFEVPRPPYLTVYAMSGYALALGALVFGVSKIYSRQQVRRREQQLESERVAQDMKILEQERIIAEQQKQLLENELNKKSMELATIALEADYKQKVIENLRENIRVQRRNGKGSKDYDTLVTAMSSDMDSKEFWNIFQNNFDLIYENFFQKLRSKYPKLTPGDLKFCALMRLNMSTKDIAEFTHMTVRGVETARYRLRRKFGLDTSESIVQFLLDFK